MAETPPIISLIAAISDNLVIGKQGGLPWSLPDDWAHFRKTTQGAPLIMGRESAQSPEALYGDTLNLVLTSQSQLELDWPHKIFHQLADALQRARDFPEIFVIGGQEVFREALPLAHRMYLTHVAGVFEGDRFFPAFDPGHWEIVSEQFHPQDQDHSHAFYLRTWERRPT